MHSFYLDASALAKRFAPEVGTAVINALFAQVTPDRMIVLNIGVAEVVSLLVRKRNTGRISDVALAQALSEVGSQIRKPTRLRKLVPNNPLVAAALPLIETHSLNGTDGVLLRSALDVAAQFRAGGNDLVLVTSDQRLLKAAQSEGLTTFNPETQTQAELAALLGP